MRFELFSSATVMATPRLINRHGSWKRQAFPIRYGVFEHPQKGLVLVDTGYSEALFQSTDWKVKIYRNLLRPTLHPAQDAFRVVRAMGADADDVRHIFLTHLHADHICGLSRFPKAHITASDVSLNGWRGDAAFLSWHKGYFPSLLPRVSDVLHRATSQCRVVTLPWGGVGHDVFDDGSMIAVDLPGHMKGHMGLFFPLLAQPILHAADADWLRAGLSLDQNPAFGARLVCDDIEAAQSSKQIIARAKEWGCKITLCHDETAD